MGRTEVRLCLERKEVKTRDATQKTVAISPFRPLRNLADQLVDTFT